VDVSTRLAPPFGGNENRPLVSPDPGNGCGRSILKHFDRAAVVRIAIVYRRTAVGQSGSIQDDAVDDVPGIIRNAAGGISPDPYVGSSSGSAGIHRDVYAGETASQGLVERSGRPLLEYVSLDRGNCRCQVGLPLCSIPDYHDFIKFA